MTHLIIQQKKVSEGGQRETVSSSFIKRLYDYTNDANLVYQSTDLKGDLSVNKTYQRYIDYLTARYPGLDIQASGIYVYFNDPVVENYWANSTYGDGIGITLTNAALITQIPQDAFKNNTSVTSFDELGSFTNLVTLNASCFEGCSNLTSINLDNVLTIKGNAFKGCTSLTAINFNHNNVTFDGWTTFNNCTSLTTVTGAENVITFSHNTFAGCTNLKNITVGENTNISGGISQNCSNLEKVSGAKFGKVSDNNTIENTFSGCSKLKCIDFYFQSSADTYDGLFSGCSQLQDLTTNDPNSINTGEQTYTFQNVTRLHSGVFFETTSLINKIFVFPSLTSITGWHCFTNCGAKSFSAPLLTSLGYQSFTSSNFQTVSIPSVTSLPEESFLNASQLQSIELPSVTSIGKDAFKNCTALITVKVGSNLTTMGQTPFVGCTSLTTIYVPSAKLSDYQTSFPDIASMMVSY